MDEIPFEKYSQILDTLAKLAIQIDSRNLPYLIIEEVKKILNADHASFVIQEEGVARYGASTDRNWEKRKPSQTVIADAINAADGIAIQGSQHSDDLSESQLQQKIRSSIAVRVDLAGGTKAAVYCDIRTVDRLFTRADAEMLRSLCHLFAPYFSTFYLNESISDSKQQNLHHLDLTISDHTDLNRIIGRSPTVVQLKEQISHAARHAWPVLIQGETGTGKELVARAIHFCSARAKGPFIPVNCASLNPELIEAELFGTKQGAFTGAIYRKGRIQSAIAGTLFLDEVGELPLSVQAKLLRAVEHNEVQMLGSDELIENVDFRLVSASNRNLHDMVKESKFRMDFLERIRVKRIYVPPLKDRREDIPALSEYYASPKQLSQEAVSHLILLDYPGNIRRLRTIVTMARDQSSGSRVEKSDIEEVLLSFEDHNVPSTSAELSMDVSITERDSAAFRKRYKKAVREYTLNFEKEGDGFFNLDPLDAGLLKEMSETLVALFKKHGASWTKVAREHFDLEDPNDRKAFIGWVYGLQSKKLIPRAGSGEPA